MAKKDPTATPADKKLPKYDVVQIARGNGEADGGSLRAGDTLTVVAVAIEAKTALDAADKIVNIIDEDKRRGEFGGYLSGSFKMDEWETEPMVVTRRKKR